ncbi:hypothetical protein POM88_010253 [Heracleum sosnowskyi]|uniref:RING-type domain-containing protein n=1 Tax=Heracleum sosnowskyi TaxID=360622 RepID=A0AAD8JDC3_9APIA|nr:hypothetical protein POM88_010253 [Heracleum sosnowskyi]
MPGLTDLSYHVATDDDSDSPSSSSEDDNDSDEDDSRWFIVGYFTENEYLYLSSDVYKDDNDDGGGREGAPHALQNILIELEEETLFCTVCQDSVNVGETAKELHCGHRFHGNCIVSWLGWSCLPINVTERGKEGQIFRRLIKLGLLFPSVV